MIARKTALLAGLALSIALLGCGAKSEPPTTGKVVPQTTTASTTSTTTTTDQQNQADLQAAQTSASAYLTSTDAAAICNEGITPSLLTKLYKTSKGCVAQRKPATLAKVSQIVSAKLGAPGTATVQATASGGDYGKGSKVTFSVVRDGAGLWRVDTVKRTSN